MNYYETKQLIIDKYINTQKQTHVFVFLVFLYLFLKQQIELSNKILYILFTLSLELFLPQGSPCSEDVQRGSAGAVSGIAFFYYYFLNGQDRGNDLMNAFL